MNLVCYCSPQLCHGDVIKEIVEAVLKKETTLRNGFTLSKDKTGKDQGKANYANVFIGFGVKRSGGMSSTGIYLEDARKQRIPVNEEIIPDKETIAFVSVSSEGIFVKKTAELAINVLKAGGTIVMDKQGTGFGQSHSSFNRNGEGAVHDLLGKPTGTTKEGYSIWKGSELKRVKKINTGMSKDMKEYRLSLDTDFPDPRVLRNPSSLGQVEGIVALDGSLTINGHRLRFIDQGIEPGTEVFRMSNWGIAKRKSDVLEYKKQREQIQREMDLEADRLRHKRRDKALDFHSSIKFPAKYHIGIKENLSGLSANSFGDGHKKNTVYHLILNEAFKEGRVERKPGEFLCSQSNSKYGANWSGRRKIDILSMMGLLSLMNQQLIVSLV